MLGPEPDTFESELEAFFFPSETFFFSSETLVGQVKPLFAS